MPIRLQRVPSPVGKTKDVVPVFIAGPSIKLALLPPVGLTDAPASKVKMFTEVVNRFPSVSVSIPLRVVAWLNVVPDEDELLIVNPPVQVAGSWLPVVCAPAPV